MTTTGNADAFVASLAPGLGILVAGRLVMGLAVGALSVSVPIYLSEITPSARRGALSGVNQLMISTAILVAYVVDLARSPEQIERGFTAPAQAAERGAARQPQGEWT